MTDEAVPDTPPSEEKPKSRSRRLCLRLTFYFCLPTFLALGSRWWWPLELATHFRVQYICLLLPLVVVLFTQRRFPLVFIPLSVLVLNAVYVLPLYVSQPQPKKGKTLVRAISANVHTGNQSYELFINLIKQKNPDFFVVMEANRDWIDQLEVLREEYPHSLVRPRSDNFGIALFSKIPFESSEIIELADSQVPTLVVTINIDGRSLSVIGTHPLPPVNSEYVGSRNRQVAALGELVRNTPGPLVVLGDLNMTSWSPYFRDLIEQTGLRDSRKGFGVQATWPEAIPPLSIPIDHALVSPEIAVSDRRVGENIGSDHRPIVVDFSLSGDE